MKAKFQQTTGQGHSRTSRFILCTLAVVVLSPLMFCGGVISAAFLSEPLARSMMPPTYPNSRLIGSDNATGSWGYTEFYRYSTPDSIAIVDNWYVNNSNLKRTLMKSGGISFDDPASDGFLSHMVGYLNKADWGSGPSAGLTISVDPKSPGLTQITIIVAWPSL
jgi:hypothetical protein